MPNGVYQSVKLESQICTLREALLDLINRKSAGIICDCFRRLSQDSVGSAEFKKSVDDLSSSVDVQDIISDIKFVTEYHVKHMLPGINGAMKLIVKMAELKIHRRAEIEKIEAETAYQADDNYGAF